MRSGVTVREVTRDLMRSLGLTTVFGNPGSTEEPFLKEWPSDLTYVLGLQEAAVVAMADGAVIGSALVDFLHRNAGSPTLEADLRQLVGGWKAARAHAP